MTDLELAIAAARAGGAAIRRWSRDSVTPEMKGAVDPVTEADHEAERVVLDLLRSHRPGDAVLAEESGGSVGPDRTWIIDPLDGTVNFVHGVPHVAVSIALFQEGLPLVGVVHDVFNDDLFTAAAGNGAHLNDAPLAVSTRMELGDSLIATGFPYDRRERAGVYAVDVERVLRNARGIRRMGTASLDLAFVAAGRFDGYWEHHLAPWDIAAGMLLVSEAGGRVTDMAGEPIRIDDFDSIMATNGAIHASLRSALLD